MPAIQVAKTDTFEQQRQKINSLGSTLFSISAGGSDLSTGNLKLGDGTRTVPSLAFVSDSSLGIYRPSIGTLGVASGFRKLIDISENNVKSYRPILIEKNALDSLFLSITNAGTGYDPGNYVDIPATGGSGSGGTLSIVVDGFVGSITNTGSGYTPGVYQSIPVSGGTGFGATFNFTVQSATGVLTSGGSGYTPGVYQSIPLTGGSGALMQASITVSNYEFTVSGGTGYPSGVFKSVSLTGGSGSGFKANLSVINGVIQNFGGAGSSVLVNGGSGYVNDDTLSYIFSTGISQTFVVTSGNGKYYLDGVQADDFAMLRGNTYIFNADNTLNSQHPIYIGSAASDTNSILGSADGITYRLNGSIVTPANYLINYAASTSRSVTFVVPNNPNQPRVYLNCSIHPNMAGFIDLVPTSAGTGFSLNLAAIGGAVSSAIITQSGNGYSAGDVLGVSNTNLGGSGNGFTFTIGGLSGKITSITSVPAFGLGYSVGDVLTLPSAVTNVSTFARGTIDKLGVNFVSNASVTSVNFAGAATGSASTYTNITPTRLTGSGTGLIVTVVKTNVGGNPIYSTVSIVNAGSGYRQGDTLTIAGSSLGGDEANSLNITIGGIEPCNPQINVVNTSGINVGDQVNIIQNATNSGQLGVNTIVTSVDNSSLITLSVSPTTPGSADIRITNQNLTYLTVPNSSLIKVGFQVVKVSGTGNIITGTPVASIINSTTVSVGIQPTEAGPMVVNFEPTYGIGSSFNYTLSKIGVVSSVSVADAGNGYFAGDNLTADNTLLTNDIEYLVTNLTISKILFAINTVPSTSIQSGDNIKDPGGSILANTVTTSTNGPIGGTYSQITPVSTSGTGVGAKFDIFRGAAGEVLSAVVSVGSGGSFYKQNDTVTLPGASVGGSTPANNIVLTVTNVTSGGENLTVYKAKSSGGFLQYLICTSASFSVGQIIVNSAADTVGYAISSSSNEFRYFIDTQDGTGAKITPNLVFYNSNSYRFNLSDPSNGSHIFAFSKYRDGQWAPSLFETVSTVVNTTSTQITVADTTGMYSGMAVEKVSGTGILGIDTEILSVNSTTSLTLSKTPTTNGSLVIKIYGKEYTDGVTRTDTSLTIKVTTSTPSLYYFCDTDNFVHRNEGGDDNEEAVITINPINPKQFGSGFDLLVTDVIKETVFSGDINGLVECVEIQTTDFTATTASISTVNSTAVNADTLNTTNLVSLTSLTATVATNTTFNTSNFKIGTTLTIEGNTGNITSSGSISSNNYLVGSNLKIVDTTENPSSILSLGGQNINFVPDLGRVVDIKSTTALVIPVGPTSSRPGTNIVCSGSIRFNTDTNQYEGYSSSNFSWSSLGGVRDLDGNTYILAESTVGSNDNTLYLVNDNVTTIKFSPTYQEFVNVKKIRSINVTAPSYTTWNSNIPVTVGQYLKYGNNIYIVVTAGVTGTSGSEPTNTTGSNFPNGTAVLAWSVTAVAPLTFEEISELRIAPTGGTPLSINGDLRLSTNVISTDINDLIIRPNSGKKVTIDAQTSLVIPVGNTNARGAALRGSIRFNTTILQYEGYDGINWSSLGGVRDVDGNTYIIPELGAGTNENILYFYNNGSNTLQLNSNKLEFRSIDTIESVTSGALNLNANLITFNSLSASIDTSSATRTLISTTKNNLDLGLSSGLNNDPLVRLTDTGELFYNIAFGTGTFSGIKVFNNTLKDFELSDYKLSTTKVTLTRGTTNSDSVVLYSPALHSASKVQIVAKNVTTGDSEFIEYSVIDKGSDIFYTEFGNIKTGLELFSCVFDFNESNSVRVTFTINSALLNGTAIQFTVINNIIKR